MVRSIHSRLLFWLMFPLTIVAAIVAIETFVSSKNTSNTLHDKTLLAASLAISENVIASNGNLIADEVLEVLTETLGEKYFYHLLGPDNAFAVGFSGYPRLPEGAKIGDNIPYFYDGVHQGEPVRVVTIRQFLTGRQLNGLSTITTWQRITQRRQLTLELFSRSLLRLLLLVVAAGLIVGWAVSRGLRPLSNLQNAIDSRTPYDLTPIKRKMPKELSGIVGSMNDLFYRVARSKSNRERFIGDAAHQLRNPIAAIKVQAETAIISKGKNIQKDGLEKIIKTTNQTGKLIEQMLASASAQAMDIESGTVFELTKMVGDVTREMAPKALAKELEISFEAEGGNKVFQIKGKELLLREAVINLIDNAIKYNEEKSKISVSISLSEVPNYVDVSISDEGIMLDDEQFLKYSQPFSTGENTNSGSGLGLSVAKDIAKSHGGWLKVSPKTDSKGKAISLVLPIVKFDN